MALFSVLTGSSPVKKSAPGNPSAFVVGEHVPDGCKDRVFEGARTYLTLPAASSDPGDSPAQDTSRDTAGELKPLR
ncbi:hypothetical protein DXT87_18210 [Arthrobacter sp. AET 35A]|jgi:hypothetical protein|nr:hypothetical protein [Arthrobacter sp. AET 35A]